MDKITPTSPWAGANHGGIPWMLLAAFLFVSMDSIVKHLVQTFPVPQIVWARYTFHAIFLLLLLRGGALRVMATRRLGVQLLRSFLLLANTLLFFLGLRVVPLAEANAIMFIAPILVTVLSVPLLREPVGGHRWFGVVAGFGGAMIILRPGTGMMAAGSLLPFGAACIYSLYQIATRILSRTDAPMTTLVYTAVVGTIASSAAVPFFWVAPDGPAWGLMALLGVLGGAAHFSLIKAFQVSRAATITPFGYTNLLWAILFGIVLFGEYPDARILVGAAVIVGSGLYIFHRERLLSQR